MSTQNTSLDQRIMGIDISKKMLDVHVSGTDKIKQYLNNEAGISALIMDYGVSPDLIVYEATGGYERLLTKKLIECGWSISLVNPRQVRDFARAKGILAKNDHIDAKLLSDFGRIMSPPPVQHHIPQHLSDLLKRREQIIDLIKKEKQHLDKSTDQNLIQDIKEHILFMEQQRDKMDAEIQKGLESDTKIKERFDILESIKGVGKQTSALLAVFMPELGSATHSQVTALAGLAPFSYESGQFKGKRHIRGGRKRVRNALYMASLSAIQFNPDIKSFYQGLRERNKPFKIAITAAMRKLLKLINALIKNNRKWEPVKI